MANDIKRIILIAVSLMVIGVIIPIAIGLVANAGNVVINSTVNATNSRMSDVADASIVLMIEVLIPIIAVIAIVLLFLPSRKSD